MALSVGAALELEVFSRLSVTIFAGQENLAREVRWVHPMEIPDIAQFLAGGELLLTAGLGVSSTPHVQRRFIQEISEAGAAALLVELSGRAFSSMPAALIEEAKRLQFPLIGLDREVPFVEVSAQVHGLLAGQVNADLMAFERLNADFIRLLLEGRSHVSFTEALAHQIGCPVVLEDADHQLVAYAGGTAQTDELTKNWRLHARVGHQDRRGDQLSHTSRSSPDGEPGCSRRRIVLRGEGWGWLHVFHGAAPLGGVNAYALERTADAIAITLTSDRESGARASQRQSSLINRLLLGDITGEQLVDRALRVGRDLRDRRLAVVVLCKTPGSEADESSLEQLLLPLELPSIVADLGEHVMAVVGLNKRTTSLVLVEHLNSSPVRAGVSRDCSAAELVEATRQARAAASVASAQEREAALHFDRLGVMRLLVALSQGPELRRYVHDELGAILEHDRAESNELLPTLRAYLENDGNKSRAAAALFVQRRTLYYRLERLDALIGRPLEDADTRAGLSLALRALDFLEAGDLNFAAD